MPSSCVSGFEHCQLRTAEASKLRLAFSQLHSRKKVAAIWVWVKITPPGIGMCWSMFPFTRASHFRYLFLTHSHCILPLFLRGLPHDISILLLPVMVLTTVPITRLTSGCDGMPVDSDGYPYQPMPYEIAGNAPWSCQTDPCLSISGL